jgi:hypothetical protein
MYFAVAAGGALVISTAASVLPLRAAARRIEVLDRCAPIGRQTSSWRSARRVRPATSS